MKKTNFTLLFILSTFMFSCAHKSGRYVMKGDSWVFEESNVGFMMKNYGESRVDDSAYEFSESGIFKWPVPSSKRISSKFGPRGRRHHDGLDIPARRGAHFVASADGVVIASTKMRGYGNIVILKHKDGYHTVYAHNQKNFVRKGQSISRGEVLGQVGSSGRSTGPHLHYEVRKNNRVRNPAMYLGDLKKNYANR